jgi:hypothetical protein
VVIEIKRGTNKLHLLQGLTYASMIAKWDGTRLLEECSQQRSQTMEEVEEWVEGFLEVDPDNRYCQRKPDVADWTCGRHSIIPVHSMDSLQENCVLRVECSLR